jgi:hypothetical protein
MDSLTSIPKIGDFLSQYASWVRWLIAGWLFYSTVCAGVLVLAQRSPQQEPSVAIRQNAENTGDPVIDGVLYQLSILKASKERAPESKVTETLAPLFSRPAFYPVREENWEHFLYALCKTRLILEESVSLYKSNAKVRDDLGRVIEMMVTIQGDVKRIYGPTFSATDHIRRHIGNRDAFIANLPPQVQLPNSVNEAKRNEAMRKIRDILRPIGLVSF